MLSLQVSLYIKISLFFPLSFGAMHLTSLHFGFLPTFGCYAATIQWHCTSRVAAKTSVAFATPPMIGRCIAPEHSLVENTWRHKFIPIPPHPPKTRTNIVLQTLSLLFATSQYILPEMTYFGGVHLAFQYMSRRLKPVSDCMKMRHTQFARQIEKATTCFP